MMIEIRPYLPRRSFAIAVLALAALVPATMTLATTIQLQSVEEMTQRASVVVRAVPVSDSSVSAWDDQGRLILTRTTLTVLETLHGDTQGRSEIEVQTLGGFIVAEDIGMAVPGAPRFVADEEVVLFLARPIAAAPLRVIDLAAGKFEIGEADGATIVTRRDMQGAEVRSAGVIVPKHLDSLRARIKAAGKRPSAGE